MEFSPLSAGDPDRLAWYAVRVKSKSELQVAAVLAAKGVQSYVPTYTALRQLADRKKNVECPLFAGYVFSRFDVEQRLPILVTPHVLQILGLGKTPTAIPDSEIRNLALVADSRLPPDVVNVPSAGEAVRIDHGPLAGVEGIILRAGGSSRLFVSVTLLRRAVTVQVEQSWVRVAEERDERGQVLG